MNLKTCPLCNTKSSVTKLEHTNGPPFYNISCGVKDDDSDTCGLVLYGNSGVSRKSMVEKWNQRASEVI